MPMHNVLKKLFASALISAALIYWLLRQGFEVLPSWSEITTHASLWAIVLYIALFCVFHVLRARRWIYLIRPFAKVNLSCMMETAFVGFVAIQMMPLRTGEVARPYLLDRYAGISKSALFGTIAVERVIDGLLVSLILTFALFAVPVAPSALIWGLRLLPLGIFSVALFLLIAFYFRPSFIKRCIFKLFGVFSAKLADFSVGVLERFHTGLRALPNRRNFWGFVLVSLLYWGINGIAFFYLARGCGVMIPLAGALAGMGCLAVGILLPAGPGYFGNFQVAVLAAVEIYIPVSSIAEEAAVFVFLLYVLQTGLTVLFGGISAWRLRQRPVRSSHPGVFAAAK
jgi:glycosyltransferase 2 family protein